MINCLIFGTGTAYLNRKYLLNYKYINILGMLDNDKQKWGNVYDGIKIDDPRNVKNYNFDYILVASSFYEEICNQLVELGVLIEQIINIYSLVLYNSRNIVVNHYITSEDGFNYGIEIGGANNPIQLLDKNIVVKQVDYCDHSLLEDAFSNMSLIKVDIIDDGEKLLKFNDGSLDFIIACHMLEHCKNPIGTIRNFLRKLRSGGIIFLAIPDKRYTFDKNRELTSIEHLLLDDMDPSDERNKEHYFDKAVDMLTDEELEYVRNSILKDERIHFHVWDANSFIEFIYTVQKHLQNRFSIEQVGNLENGVLSNEILCVLRKR